MYRYITEVLKISPSQEGTIQSFLQASSGFVAWLSSIHDEQEEHALYKKLLGSPNDMFFHRIRACDVMRRQYAIPVNCFKLVGTLKTGHIGVIGLPESRQTFSSPTMSCPFLSAGGMVHFWDQCVLAYILARRHAKTS